MRNTSSSRNVQIHKLCSSIVSKARALNDVLAHLGHSLEARRVELDYIDSIGEDWDLLQQLIPANRMVASAELWEIFPWIINVGLITVEDIAHMVVATARSDRFHQEWMIQRALRQQIQSHGWRESFEEIIDLWDQHRQNDDADVLRELMYGEHLL